MIKELEKLSPNLYENLKSDLIAKLEAKDSIISQFLLANTEKYELQKKIEAKKRFRDEFSAFLEKNQKFCLDKEKRIQKLKKWILNRIECKKNGNYSVINQHAAEVQLLKSTWLEKQEDFENEKKKNYDLIKKIRSELFNVQERIETLDEESKDCQKKIQEEVQKLTLYKEMHQKNFNILMLRLIEVNKILHEEQENSLKLVNEISEIENEF